MYIYIYAYPHNQLCELDLQGQTKVNSAFGFETEALHKQCITYQRLLILCKAL